VVLKVNAVFDGSGFGFVTFAIVRDAGGVTADV